MKSGLLIIALAVVGALSGCQNSVNSVENAEKQASPNIIKDARFQTDGWLRDRLLLKGVNTTVNFGGIMQVQVTALNDRTGFFNEMWSGITGEDPYRVEYRFQWMDANGMEVHSPTSIWKQRIIEPGETVRFESIAPSAQCKDFVLSLKESE